MSYNLAGVREISALLGVTRQRADQWTRTKGFPEPLAELASGRIWDKEQVMEWATKQFPPSAVVKRELSNVPRGRNASAESIYRMVYAMTRQRGLGKRAQAVPPTREFAHAQALAEARKTDPTFSIRMPSA